MALFSYRMFKDPNFVLGMCSDKKNYCLGRMHTPVELFCVKSDSSCGFDKVGRSLKKKVKKMM